ncbi:MAG: TetR/AcrR family transcriptional regulator [Gammaproteobacteria bacterium]|nr:TetR/AcrR family transcriptional regulator [Gammaproteobacteria bacterium]
MPNPSPAAARPLRPDDGRRLRGQKSRARILAAARELFAERGFDRTTLRAIAERAGMGASSIYRHIRSKEELLVEELVARQEEAWRKTRGATTRDESTEARLTRFFETQHELLAADRDLTTIALRALTHPEARVARRVLALHDRSIGLLAEILQGGRMRGDISRRVDVLETARALFFTALGARIAWANGLLTSEGCERSIAASLELLFAGIGPGD